MVSCSRGMGLGANRPDGAEGQTSAYYIRARSYSRSYNAHRAEEDGRMPLTRAVAYVAEHAVTTQAIARAVLLRRGTDEWHHVGKYAMPVYYYDAVSAVDWAWAITPAATREQVLRRWTRLAFAEARDRRYREQLAVVFNCLCQQNARRQRLIGLSPARNRHPCNCQSNSESDRKHTDLQGIEIRFGERSDSGRMVDEGRWTVDRCWIGRIGRGGRRRADIQKQGPQDNHMGTTANAIVSARLRIALLGEAKALASLRGNRFAGEQLHSDEEQKPDCGKPIYERTAHKSNCISHLTLQ